MRGQYSKVIRRPIVGVIGSGEQSWEDRACELGRCLAHMGMHLLTGAGGGVMASVSQGFAETVDRKGLVIGIVPCHSQDEASTPKEGYPNPWVEIPIATHLPFSGTHGTHRLSRNHIVVLSSDVLVALPGGDGTFSEMELAVRYVRPLVAYLRHRDECPDMSTDIPVVHAIDAVKEFVQIAVSER